MLLLSKVMAIPSVTVSFLAELQKSLAPSRLAVPYESHIFKVSDSLQVLRQSERAVAEAGGSSGCRSRIQRINKIDNKNPYPRFR